LRSGFSHWLFAHRILDASHIFYRQFLGRNER
jgi:hypothetical protein